MGEWGSSGRSWRVGDSGGVGENCNQNTVYEKIIFNKKEYKILINKLDCYTENILKWQNELF